MTNARDPFGEDVSLLYPDSRGERFNRLNEGYCETPIVKGVVSQLRRWPADVFYAFMAACFIIGSLVFLIFITVAVCVPTVAGNSVGEISILEIEGSPNVVYFFKLGNRQWSTREFCYIETAAHKHPDLNVYLINLLKEEPRGKRSNETSGNETKLETKLNDSLSTSHLSPGLTPEERLRERLVLANGNIRNINVSVEKFFKGSKLSRVARAFDDESLEMAAKTHLLWSIPGIALKPSMYCALDSMKQFLCKNKTECLPDKLAIIEPENGIQATGVPCQAFMGFLLREISKSHLRGKYTLKDAVDKYCPRAHYCPEIRILDARAKCPTEAIDCPIVYSTTISQGNPNPGDFVT